MAKKILVIVSLLTTLGLLMVFSTSCFERFQKKAGSDGFQSPDGHAGETAEEHAAHSHEGESEEEHAAHSEKGHEGESAEEHEKHSEGGDHEGHEHGEGEGHSEGEGK